VREIIAQKCVNIQLNQWVTDISGTTTSLTVYARINLYRRQHLERRPPDKSNSAIKIELKQMLSRPDGKTYL
jgi:hypothetical protein